MTSTGTSRPLATADTSSSLALCPEDAEHFHFDVPICVSQQFFGWVCGFGGKVEVTAPAAVRAQLHEMVQSLAEQHE